MLQQLILILVIYVNYQIVCAVLPKFEVTVKPPSFLVSSDTSVEVTVTAKYVYRLGHVVIK